MGVKMAKIDTLLEGLIESQVETLIQDDSYYQLLSTPLKSASIVKKEHRKQLVEFFKLKELRNQLEVAPNIILNLLPDLVSKEEFVKIKGELDGSGEHFIHFIESMNKESSEKPILFQEMFGLSDDTLLRIYDLAVDLIKKENYEDANTLLVFLTTLAPHVTSYWIAEGACLQALDRHQEAIAVFSAAKFLSPSDPAPSFYSIESFLILDDKDKAKLELDEVKEIVKSLSGEDKLKWEKMIKEVKIV